LKIIAGLGNPTKEYVGTRHNIGFDGVTAIADKYRISVTEKAHNALVGKGIINGERVLLMKPQTYMNLSGEAIGDAMRFYKLDPEDLIVIYDDVNLEPGAIRVREGGSAGGHNGMKNIIQHVGTEKFPRVRIGVGEKPKEWDLKDYVLGHFSRDDEPKMREALGNTVTAVEMIVSGDIQRAMSAFNKKKKAPEQPAEETSES
jgi:PTH1 family peptidyl-tRNA hydrolase